MMKPVKTKPRFRCDFCRRVSTEQAMIKTRAHLFPESESAVRLLPIAATTRRTAARVDGAIPIQIPCPYCSKFQTREQWEQGLGATT
jgi:hypothetical protein